MTTDEVDAMGSPFDNIPHELREHDQWVTWGKWHEKDKVPMTWAGGLASSTDPETWGDFETVMQECERLGFVLTEDDPYFFIDLDNCIVDGTLNEEAREIVRLLDSYTELSPSGRGLHIIVRTAHPPCVGRKAATSFGAIEMYDHSRYMTMTGRVLVAPGDGKHGKRYGRLVDPGNRLNEVFDRYFPAPPETAVKAHEPPRVDDAEVYDRCYADGWWRHVHDNGTPPHSPHKDTGEPDWNRIEFGYCCRLAAFTWDPEQIDRIYRLSALSRVRDPKKWDDPRPGGTVGSERIAAAIEAVKREAASSPEVPDAGPVWDGEAYFAGDLRSVGEFFKAVAESVQVPEPLVAMTGLAIASGCMGKTCTLSVGGYTELPQLFVLGLAESGERKSSFIRHLRRPVDAWEEAEVARVQLERDILLPQVKALKQRVGTALRQDDQDEAARLRKEIEDLGPIPAIPQFISTDATQEALAKALSTAEGRGVLIAAEADSLAHASGRTYGDRGRSRYSTFLAGYSGEPLNESRVTRDGVRVAEASLAMSMLAQPEVVLPLWSDPQSQRVGMTPRMLVVYPESMVGYRNPLASMVSTILADQWAKRLQNLLAIPPQDDRDLRVNCRFTPEAEAAWLRYAEDVEEGLRPGGRYSSRRLFAQRLPGTVLRLSLVLHGLSTWAVDGKVGEDRRLVSEAVLASAIALTKYLDESEAYAREQASGMSLTTSEPKTFDPAEVDMRMRDWIQSKVGECLNGSSPPAWMSAEGKRASQEAVDRDLRENPIRFSLRHLMRSSPLRGLKKQAAVDVLSRLSQTGVVKLVPKTRSGTRTFDVEVSQPSQRLSQAISP